MLHHAKALLIEEFPKVAKAIIPNNYQAAISKIT
jgi:hypothetical protein